MAGNTTTKRNQIYRFNRLTGSPCRFNGKRANKNTHPNDYVFKSGRKPRHTDPVKITCADDTGVRDPSRRRHNETKLVRKNKKLEAAANAQA